MFKTLTTLVVLLTPLTAHAADSISLSDCSSASAKITFTVDDDDSIVIWDGSNADNSISIPVNATGSVSSQLQDDFADYWGGSSNAAISAYIFSASSVTASCDD